MNKSKRLTLSAGLMGVLGLGACTSTDNGYQDAYGNDYGYSSGYAPPAGTAGNPYGAPANQTPGYGAYDPGAYPPPSNPNYGNSGNYYSETGEVISLPGDGASTGGRVSAPPSNTPASQIYTVVRGDNLYRIAKRYGTSMEAIRDANSLTSTVIHPGQQLIIPR